MTDALDFAAIAADLDRQGWALTGPLLTPRTCLALQALYAEPDRFRSRVVMGRHGFGEGEYQYFADPLPDPLPALRRRLYAGLAPVANGWNARLGRAGDFPDDLEAFTARCRAAGQTRPTSLLLKYGPGDYNRLHQDLYGDLVFPLQTAILLSPGAISTAGNWCWSNRSRAASHRPTSSPCNRAAASSSPSANAPWPEPAATTGSRCATASAASDQAGA